MASKKNKKRKKYDPNYDLLVIRVGTAGIGRQGFKAWVDEGSGMLERIINRQDGEDKNTYETPGEALAALGRQIDIECAFTGWHDWVRGKAEG